MPFVPSSMSLASVRTPRQRRGAGGDVVTVTASITLLLGGGTSLAQVTFDDMGVLPNGTSSRALGVSGDGVVVVGDANGISSGLPRASRWTTAAGVQLIPTPPTIPTSRALAANADGSLIVGNARIGAEDVPARWSSTLGFSEIGLLPGTNSGSALAVSGDGVVTVGLCFSTSGTRAFRHTDATGMQDLGVLPGGTVSIAEAISDDGSVVAGSSSNGGSTRAIRWTATTGMEDLGTLKGMTESNALGASATGEVLVGESHRFLDAPPFFEGYPFRWSQSEGMVELPSLPGGVNSAATAVSDDGTVIVGYGDVGPSTPRRAVFWTASLGAVDLREYLITEHGLDLTGWQLEQAKGVSGDGSTIVGIGRRNGAFRGWIVRGLLTPPCPADLNDDGVVDGTDLTIMLGAWDGRGPADLNGDGVVNGADLTILLGAWGDC